MGVSCLKGIESMASKFCVFFQNISHINVQRHSHPLRAPQSSVWPVNIIFCLITNNVKTLLKYFSAVGPVETLDALGKKNLFLPTNKQRIFMNPVLDTYNVRNTVLFKYLRLRLGRQVYYSKEYTRVKNKKSYVVATTDDRFGEIHFYICAGNVHFAVIRLCNVLCDPVVHVPRNVDNELHRKYGNAVLCPHVKKISFTENFILMHISKLAKKCVAMKFGENEFVSEPPNLLEHN